MDVCAHATKIRRHSYAADCGSSPRFALTQSVSSRIAVFLTFLTFPLLLLCLCLGVYNIHCTFPPSCLSWGVVKTTWGLLVVAEASRKKCVLEGGVAQRSGAWIWSSNLPFLSYASWVNILISLCLNAFSYKMGYVMVLNYRNCCSTHRNHLMHFQSYLRGPC